MSNTPGAWRRRDLITAAELQPGDRLATGETVSTVSVSRSDGTVFVHADDGTHGRVLRLDARHPLPVLR